MNDLEKIVAETQRWLRADDVVAGTVKSCRYSFGDMRETKVRFEDVTPGIEINDILPLRPGDICAYSKSDSINGVERMRVYDQSGKLLYTASESQYERGTGGAPGWGGHD